MKVLHLTDDLTGVSGVRTYLLGLQEALSIEGIDCQLWSPPPGHDAVSSYLSRWASPRYYRGVRVRLAATSPDIVHAHNLWMRLSPTPLRAARIEGIPVVMTVHDYHLVCPRKWMITADWAPCERGFGWGCLLSGCRSAREGRCWLPYNDLRWLKVWFHRRMLRAWVDRFVAPSEHLATWLRTNLGVDNVVHIPNFTEAPDQAISADERGRVLLYVGRLSREKGVQILLRAMPAVLNACPNARLRVVGDGPQRGDLQRLATRLGLDAGVEFVGARSPERLDEVYRGCGAFVLPSLWMENCPVAVLEAMARGLPVIASRIGGVPELVNDGVTGVLVRSGDPDDLAEQAVRLLRDETLMDRMGRAAVDAFSRRYAPEVHARRLGELYRRLVLEGGLDGG